MEEKLSFVEQVAERLKDWLPELEGRSIAVSEIEPIKSPEELPALPLAAVAMVGQTYEGPEPSQITTRFAIEIMLKPVRYKDKDGCDTPFWAYYDSDSIRDRIFVGMQEFAGTNPVSMEVDATRLAVFLSFEFDRQSKWDGDCPQFDECGKEINPLPAGASISFRTLPFDPCCGVKECGCKENISCKCKLDEEAEDG